MHILEGSIWQLDLPIPQKRFSSFAILQSLNSEHFGQLHLVWFSGLSVGFILFFNKVIILKVKRARQVRELSR
jgi:hypothetical protein